jgi:heme o synthase
MKLRMVLQILITTFVGYYLGVTNGLHWAVLLNTLSGTALLAIAAFALNQSIEKHPDSLMQRTRNRPIPTEKISQTEARLLGFGGFILGTANLYFGVNPLTALLGALSLILYAWVYTPFKRISSLNTLIGAIPGALPPLMGWTAAQNSLGLGGVVLFAILFFWQLPHFLALAWMYKQDYTDGGFKMLSVTDPSGQACFRHILIQTLCLILVSFLPYMFHLAGLYYLVFAVSLGFYFLYTGWQLYRLQTREAARKVFFTSIIYLPIVLVMIAINKVVIIL